MCECVSDEFQVLQTDVPLWKRVGCNVTVFRTSFPVIKMWPTIFFIIKWHKMTWINRFAITMKNSSIFFPGESKSAETFDMAWVFSGLLLWASKYYSTCTCLCALGLTLNHVMCNKAELHRTDSPTLILWKQDLLKGYVEVYPFIVHLVKAEMSNNNAITVQTA